jgi:ABC-type sugar transport system substrate-binding protein
MKSFLPRLGAALALCGLALAAAACGGGAGTGGASGGAGASSSPGSPGQAAARPVVGAILMQQDQFFRMNEQGMQAAADALGADLKVQNAGGALDKEATILDTFLAQKVDAVVVSPLGSQASIPALQRAHERGVKVVTYNNGIAADFPVANIQSDQESLGATSGQAARAYIETRLGGKAKVALIGFASQLPEQGGARQRGFKKALEGMAGVTIVAEQDAWNAPEAATTVAALLTKHPDIVWAANEGGTVGAVTAVKSAGLAGKVAVFGTDISAQLVDLLLAEDGILQAVTAQKPVDMGRSAVESAVRAVRGEPVEKSVVLPGLLFGRERPDELRAFKESLEQGAK